MKRLLLASLVGSLLSSMAFAQVTWRASGPDVTTTSNSFSCVLSNNWKNYAVSSNVLPAGISGSVIFQYNSSGKELKIGLVSSAIDPVDYAYIRPNYFGDGIFISAFDGVKSFLQGDRSSNNISIHTVGTWYKIEVDRSAIGTGTITIYDSTSSGGPWDTLAQGSYSSIFDVDLHFVITTSYGPISVDNISLQGGWETQTTFPEPTEKHYAWQVVPSSTTDIYSSGTVGVGFSDISSGDYSLYVSNGGLRAEKVQIDLPSSSAWPDFVFSDGYQLMTLSGVERFILENGHLPNLPIASVIHSNGANVEEVISGLLKTIEEMMLHTIEQEKQIEKLKSE